MRIPRHGLAALATTGLLVTSLAACGGGGDGDGEKENAEAPEPTALWVASHFDKTFSRVDLKSGDITETITIEAMMPSDVSFYDGAAWATNGYALVRTDLASGETEVMLDQTEAGVAGAHGVLAAEGQVWIGQAHPGRLTPYDPAADALGDPIDMGVEEFMPEQMTLVDRKIYGYDGLTSELFVVDVESGDVVWKTPESAMWDLVVSDGQVWIGSSHGVDRLDPDTLEVAESHELESSPFEVAIDPQDGTLWAALDDGTVVHLSEDGTQELGRAKPPKQETDGAVSIGPTALVVAGGKAWVVLGGTTLVGYDAESLEITDTHEISKSQTDMTLALG